MNVCVYASAQSVGDPYESAARKVGAGVARMGHDLIWGGSNIGLCKIVADGAHANGARLIAVSVEHFQHLVRDNADETIIAPDLQTRRKIMLNKCDGIITLPGGTGTLDEIAEAIEEKKRGFIDIPLVLVNVAGFYTGFIEQLALIDKRGFSSKKVSTLLSVFDTPEQALAHLGKSL